MQHNSKQKSVSSILQQSKNELADLINKVNQLQELNQHLQNILDPKLAKHCQVANFDKSTLVLVVDNSNWATRIRYMIPDLIAQLKQISAFHTLKTIQCIISPDELDR